MIFVFIGNRLVLFLDRAMTQDKKEGGIYGFDDLAIKRMERRWVPQE